MAKIPKFCPEGGVEIGGKPVCEKCGFDTNITEDKKMSENNSGSSTWDSLEPIVSTVGKYAWIYGIVAGAVYAIWGIYLVILSMSIFGIGLGNGIWMIINAVVLIVGSLLWVKPKFSTPCGEKDWEKLLTDVVVLGNIQIPWMLIMGVVLEIFGYGWGGAIVLIAALLIIFLGPRKYVWKVNQ
ncbi:MAG: hypothetical protein ACTSRD_09880 [Promethearchaeota archaeon]